ncbi:myocardin-related transcription factor A-like isoform X5 [Salvelinus fontinalis]|uniref:myocardin-related transcription factor A-like isoform X5 n=1 Tax=Salvelinus fontinalis TaxID=8038 RepID=UPI002486403C|nr:myocardin-related transcription factor A-like isoform X5 [Salvelinus fontinalis]XP_055790200.1 myocardin-related transcription factor A-like isoform X5 [Salvelinus fontinalis]
MVVAVAPGSAPSPRSEAVTNELQEMTLQPASNSMPVRDRKNVLQLKLQQRRTREELVSQGIMPPLKSPAAFHEQRRNLERARTEDYLKRKIRSRPERSELVRMHILEETSAEPSLQAKQLQLKRARLADDLNDKISHRPGPIELIHKNILPVDLDCPLQHSLLDSPKGAGESSLDEDSSDAFSPDTLANHDSPLGPLSQLSPSDMLTQNRDMSPSQFLTQVPPPPPQLVNGQDSLPPQKLTNGSAMSGASCPATGQTKSKPSSERPPQRPKKAKDNKPKVKKLKYHQYIPPDQKADREPPPQLDSTYTKILHQQQLFLQLQILHQQQQHYNYHTILPAPPKPPAEQPPSTNPAPSLLRSVPPTTSASSNQNGSSRQSQTPVGGTKPLTLPANLDDFKVAELKQELKLRCLTVSGTKMDLIERLRNYQEQNGGGRAGVTATVSPKPSQPTPPQASTEPAGSISPAPSQAGTNPLTHHSGEAARKIPAFSLAQSAAPACIMRFGSTSSSPPLSPTPSERSLAVMSPDETSCNGDVFGEMVSSPLTQLSLHPSPQHPFPASIKEENQGHLSTCSLSQSQPSPTKLQPAAPPQEPLAGATMEASPLDKDQMLQEKDKQIEELTRMLRQKQRLVENLRSQLEQGLQTGAVREMEGEEMEGEQGVVMNGYAQEAQTTPIKASTILHLSLTNTDMVRVKNEVETEEGMEGVDEAQPTQCSQQTLLKLQQIPRIQVEQQTQQILQTQQLKQQQTQQQQTQQQQTQQQQTQQQQTQQQQTQQQQTQQQQTHSLQQQQTHSLQQQQTQQHSKQLQQQQTQQMQQQKTSALLLFQQQQQLIIQQTQQKQLQLQAKQLQAKQLQAKQLQAKQLQAKQLQAKQLQDQQLQDQQLQDQQLQDQQLQDQQLQDQQLQDQQLQAKQLQDQQLQDKQLQDQQLQDQQLQDQQLQVLQRTQQRQQQNKQPSQTVTPQQVTPVFISQQNGTQVPAQTFSLDLLKSGTTPTLVTDSNGNHYLIALTNNSAEGQNGVTSLGKTSGSQRITLQRLQSTSSKLPSQLPAEILSPDTQSKQQLQPGPVTQFIKKKAGLHLETNGITNGVPEPTQSVSAPLNLDPFFGEVSNLSESQSTSSLSLKREVCPTFDRHTLFTPPSPEQTSFSFTQRPKENRLSSQQMDDLFDILLKSGEISGFRANPDSSLAQNHSDPPTPPSSPLHISPSTTPPESSLPAVPSQQPSPSPCTGSGRLEDFLESTTGTPLLGVEPDGGLTLIDDLHSQMLSTPSILDHPPSPVDMDTSDLGFSTHPAGLDFGDPALDSMDWLDISMGGGGGRTSLAPLGPHTPPSVFSADFLDSSDLTLHWDSCL